MDLGGGRMLIKSRHLCESITFDLLKYISDDSRCEAMQGEYITITIHDRSAMGVLRMMLSYCMADSHPDYVAVPSLDWTLFNVQT